MARLRPTTCGLLVLALAWFAQAGRAASWSAEGPCCAATYCAETLGSTPCACEHEPLAQVARVSFALLSHRGELPARGSLIHDARGPAPVLDVRATLVGGPGQRAPPRSSI